MRLLLRAHWSPEVHKLSPSSGHPMRPLSKKFSIKLKPREPYCGFSPRILWSTYLGDQGWFAVTSIRQVVFSKNSNMYVNWWDMFSLLSLGRDLKLPWTLGYSVSDAMWLSFFFSLKEFFYCGKNTWHEIYPFNKFLSVKCSIGDYSYNDVQQISRISLSCLIETSCPLISNHPFPLSLNPWKPALYFFDCMDLTILHTLYKQNLFFCGWLISLGIMTSRYIRVIPYYRISFFFTAVQYSVVCTHHIFFSQSATDKYLGCVHILAILSHAAVNMGVQISLQTSCFSTFEAFA